MQEIGYRYPLDPLPQVDPSHFHVLGQWQRGYNMETVRTWLHQDFAVPYSGEHWRRVYSRACTASEVAPPNHSGLAAFPSQTCCAATAGADRIAA